MTDRSGLAGGLDLSDRSDPADAVASVDLDGSPYQGYLYGYPHKTAYRPLRPRPALREIWTGEPQDALFLYLHLPFCEMRCGFCNLFTRANPPAEQVSAYLRQLAAQATRVRETLSADADFASVAVGGGTPTYLAADELSRLFDLLADFGVRLGQVPVSVETSPATATADRIAVLAQRGTTRISMGVQSFSDAEAHAAGRPQRRAAVERALETLRSYPIPVLNLDLIYGITGQSARSWADSLTAALRWQPEELYLYPLYVRPLTGLGRRVSRTGASVADVDWDAQRLALYRQGRDTLLAAGFRQLSMRHFRRAGLPDADGGHRCQEDGMVGLGCGARSYTTGLHYSFDYAVGVDQVRAIIDDYLRRPAGDFDHAEVGFPLDRAEQRRRWLVTSLLRAEGLDPVAYRGRFGTGVEADFPQLATLAERGWLEQVPFEPTATGPRCGSIDPVATGRCGPAEPTAAAGPAEQRLRLTPSGLERSDAIGPWLVSGPVRAAMTGYDPR